MPDSTAAGDIIRQAMKAEGMEDAELARRLGRSPATVRRLANGQEPTIDQLNVLVSSLPVSAEKLLRAYGAALNPPELMQIPKVLGDLLVSMTPEEHAALITLLEPLARRSKK